MSQTIQHALATFLMPIAIALASAISGLTVRVLLLAGKKLGITISAAEADYVRGHARDVVLEVEEWSAKKAEAGLKPTADAMLARAQNALAARIPTLTPDRLDQIVHAAVAELGLGAAASQLQQKVVTGIGVVAQRLEDPASEPKSPGSSMPAIAAVPADAPAVAVGSSHDDPTK